MPQYTGWVVDVTPEPLGSALLDQLTYAQIEAGVTVLPLGDAVDFDETGGTLDINGHQLLYVSADLDADTVALFEPLPLDLADPASTSTDPDTGAVVEDPGGLEVGTTVAVWDAANNAPATVRMAYVRLGGEGADDDPVPCLVSHALIPLLPIGVREGVGETVLIDDASGTWRVIDVQGKQAVLDGTVIDPSTLPEAGEPTVPPVISPVPAVTGSVRTIIGSHQLVAGAGSTTYELHLAVGTVDATQSVAADGAVTTTATSNPPDSVPSAATLVDTTNGSQWQITHMPGGDADGDGNPDSGDDGNPLLPETDYWVAIVAKNAAGAAPPSAWVGPVRLRPITNQEIAAEFGYFGDLVADQIKGGILSAVISLAGQFTTRSDETEPGGEFDAAGLRGYGLPAIAGENAPLLTDIRFDGSTNTFAGDIAARKFTANQGADFFGDANNIKADGGMYLESGVSAGSGAAPTVALSVPSIPLARPTAINPFGDGVDYQFNAGQCVDFNWDPPSGAFTTHQNISGKGSMWWRIRLDGTVDYISASSGWYNLAWIRPDGNTFWNLMQQVGKPSNRWISGRKGAVSSSLQVTTANAPVASYGWGGFLHLAEVVSGKVITRRYDVTGTHPVLVATWTSGAWWPTAQALGSVNVCKGPAMASAEYVFAPRNVANGLVRVAHTATTELPEMEWLTSPAVIGICPDALDGVEARFWYGLGVDNRLYRYTNLVSGATSAGLRHVVGSTAATANAETQVGQKVPFLWKKRHQVTITAPEIVEPAVRAGIYLSETAAGLPTDAQMHRQDYTGTGSRTLTVETPDYAGLGPGGAPTADPYPVQSPAWLRSEKADADGSLLDLNGNGKARMGQIATRIDGTLEIRKGQVGIVYRGTAAAAQSIPNGGSSPWTTLAGWAATHNKVVSEEWFTYSAGVWTAKVAGSYLVTENTLWSPSANPGANARFLSLVIVNGSEWDRGEEPVIANVTGSSSVTTVVSLAVGDTLSVSAYQNTGSAVNANTRRITITRQG